MRSVADRPESTVHPDGLDPEPDAAQPRGRPFLPVALALGGLVVVLLAAAFVLDRQYRRPVGIEPAPPIAVQAPPTAVPNAAVRAAPTAAPPTVVPTATTAPRATLVPTLVPVPAAVGPAAPAEPTVDPLQQEIAEAYLRYWQVRKEAYLKMDPALLEQVMAGDKLERERGYMEQLKSKGQGARIEATHKFVVVKATTDEAVVFDEYLNRSPLIDLATGNELPIGTPETEKVSVTMKKVDGVWKVVESTFHD